MRFFHGLGDASLFARMIPLYLDRGETVSVECELSKAPVFEAGGAKIAAPGQGEWTHEWWMPTQAYSLEHRWSGNKAGESLPWKEDWNKLCKSEVRMPHYYPDIVPEEWPRPIILLHAMGNTGQGEKNMDKEMQAELICHILDWFDGTIVIMDWDSRAHWILDHHVKNMFIHMGNLNVQQTASLMYTSDLFIGIDSGPTYLAALTDIPVIASFHLDRHPKLAALPSPRTIFYHNTNKCEAARFVFNVQEDLSVNELTREILSPRRFFKDSATDAHMWATLQKCKGVDKTRCHTFDYALQACNKDKPTIVETGTIRGHNDWAGAGYSTVILARFCNVLGGKLYSIDTNKDNLNFAASKLAEYELSATMVHNKGEDALKIFGQHIDLLYLDSLDTESAEHQDVNLAEFKAAEEWLTDKSVVVLDDTPLLDWGKGVKTIQYALERGWRIAKANYQVVLRK